LVKILNQVDLVEAQLNLQVGCGLRKVLFKDEDNTATELEIHRKTNIVFVSFVELISWRHNCDVVDGQWSTSQFPL